MGGIDFRWVEKLSLYKLMTTFFEQNGIGAFHKQNVIKRVASNVIA